MSETVRAVPMTFETGVAAIRRGSKSVHIVTNGVIRTAAMAVNGFRRFASNTGCRCTGVFLQLCESFGMEPEYLAGGGFRDSRRRKESSVDGKDWLATVQGLEGRHSGRTI